MTNTIAECNKTKAKVGRAKAKNLKKQLLKAKNSKIAARSYKEQNQS